MDWLPAPRCRWSDSDDMATTMPALQVELCANVNTLQRWEICLWNQFIGKLRKTSLQSPDFSSIRQGLHPTTFASMLKGSFVSDGAILVIREGDGCFEAINWTLFFPTLKLAV